MTSSPSLSPRLKILNKNQGSRSNSPRSLKLENSKIIPYDSEHQSRKLQNHLCLQVLDGEPKLLIHKTLVKDIKTTLDVMLEQERMKINTFKFPEPGKFLKEDERLDETWEKEIETE